MKKVGEEVGRKREEWRGGSAHLSTAVRMRACMLLHQ